MNGENYGIPEVQGELAITRFLEATRKMLPAFADLHLLQIHSNPDYQLAGQPISLKNIGDAFMRTAQASRTTGKRGGHGIFATTYQGASGEGKECPCHYKDQTHHWTSQECETIQHILLNKPFI